MCLPPPMYMHGAIYMHTLYHVYTMAHLLLPLSSLYVIWPLNLIQQSLNPERKR
jgi:hypothetical protein